MKPMILLVSCLLLGQTQAASFFRSGEDLGDLGAPLATQLHADKQAFAMGYVAGTADATSGVTWCPGGAVTEDRIYFAVGRFMRTHPGSLKRNAATIVSEALAADFPCGKK